MIFSPRSVFRGRLKPLIALAGLVLVLWFSFSQWQAEYVPASPAGNTPVSAKIVSFAPDRTIYRIGQRASIVVYAKASSGEIGKQQVAIERIEGCKIGDAIEAELRGIHLLLKPKPCRS